MKLEPLQRRRGFRVPQGLVDASDGNPPDDPVETESNTRGRAYWKNQIPFFSLPSKLMFTYVARRVFKLAAMFVQV